MLVFVSKYLTLDRDNTRSCIKINNIHVNVIHGLGSEMCLNPSVLRQNAQVFAEPIMWLVKNTWSKCSKDRSRSGMTLTSKTINSGQFM